MRALRRGGGCLDDLIQRLPRFFRQRLDVAHDRLPALHLRRGTTHLLLESQHDVARFVGGACTLLGQLAHLVGDNGEPLAVLPCPCGFDRGIEREEVGLIGQLANDGDELGDALRRPYELVDLSRALGHEPLRAHEPLDRRANR